MQDRLTNLAISNVLSNAVNIGNRLHLFKALAEISSEENPVLPEKIAERAGCKERYVREWCNTLACGNILEVNEKEEFWIANENSEALTTENFPLVFNTMLSTVLKPIQNLIECFRKDGPYGLDYNVYSDFEEMQQKFAKVTSENHIIPSLVPAIGNGIQERLQSGIRVLDVGCGSGIQVKLLAEHFPNSHFIGLDITEKAIEAARLLKKSDGSDFENLEFLVADAGDMPKSYTDSFDLVLLFGSCHDQMRPDLCMKEVHRVVKSDGIVAVTDVDGSSNVYTDRETYGKMAAMKYGGSMLHCLPVGSNSPDALCCGSMWGRRRAVELMNKCGFFDVEIIPTDYFPGSVLYVMKK
uniref:Methyltranfer_dom domain-containing protein n=1 Tax=Caenorhabditis tropicalis TaxID=1561998 RepID=A0A1I7TY43_9PELO